MDPKGEVKQVSPLVHIPIPEDAVVYVAAKGSLHSHDCSVFGLGEEEIKALTKKFPGSGTGVVNGVLVKTSILNAINSLSLLGYKVICSTGETEITWTLQREI